MSAKMKSVLLISSLCITTLISATALAQIPDKKPLSGVRTYGIQNSADDEFYSDNPIVLFSTIDPNVRVNQDHSGLHQNETSIAVNPLNQFNLVGGANDYRNGEVDAGYYYSYDGGLTWNDGTLCCWPDLDAQGTPSLTCDANGNFYYATIAFDRDDADNGVYVSKSTDGGSTWGQPVTVYEHFGDPDAPSEDKEYIAADITNSPYRNNLYISWTCIGSDYPILFSRSINGGATFSSPIVVSSYRYDQGSVPAVGPQGDVYVVWFAYGSPNYIRINRSTNGGVSFDGQRNISQVTQLPSMLPPSQFRVNSFPSIAVDISGGAHNGYIHVVWSDYRNGDADIYYSRSANRGVSWSSAVRINDDPIGNGKDQFFPWISCDPDGNVHVFFYDRRNSSDNSLIEGAYTESTDGGNSWSACEIVSDQAFNPNIGFNGMFIGDRNGLASVKNKAFPLWTDTRLGNQDIYTSRIITTDNMPFINLGIRPASSSINIPAQGGTFAYTGIIGNNYDAFVRGDIWIVLTLPNGEDYGPLWVARNIPMNGRAVNYYQNVVQNVPYWAYPGQYVYRAYGGDYPGYVVDSIRIKFNKSGVDDKGRIDNWEADGWGKIIVDPLNPITDVPDLGIENYPNPFNDATTISYLLPRTSHVKLAVYNLRGQKVALLVDENQDAGTHSVTWNAGKFSSGIYFYKLEAGTKSAMRRMTLLK